MRANGIEAMRYGGEGFRPLLVRPGWQVAQLNDRADLHVDTVCQIERHDATDEVFLLVKGDAVLVVAEMSGGEVDGFECVPMEQGVTYNVPGGVWHAIVTTPGVQVMIVEKDGTEAGDVFRRNLAEEEREALKKGVLRCAR